MALQTIEDKHEVAEMVCQEHRNEELSWYCEDCGVLVCYRCVSGSGKHNNHECGLLNEVFQEFKDTICMSQAQVGKHLNKIERVLKKLCTCRDQVLCKINSLENDVNGDTRKTQLMSQVQRLAQSKLNVLDRHEQRLNLLQSRFASCLDLLEKSLYSDNPFEVLRKKCGVVNEITKLTALVQSNAILQSPEALSAVFLIDIEHFKVKGETLIH